MRLRKRLRRFWRRLWANPPIIVKVRRETRRWVEPQEPR